MATQTINGGSHDTVGDRTYKLGSGITSEYGRYVKYPGVPVAGVGELSPMSVPKREGLRASISGVVDGHFFANAFQNDSIPPVIDAPLPDLVGRRLVPRRAFERPERREEVEPLALSLEHFAERASPASGFSLGDC